MSNKYSSKPRRYSPKPKLTEEEQMIVMIKNDLKEAIDNDFLRGILYDMVPAQMNIKYIPDLELAIESGKDISEALLEIVDKAGDDEIEDFRDAVAKFHPEYLDKLKTIITFQ